jgi:hypothetical protein
VKVINWHEASVRNVIGTEGIITGARATESLMQTYTCVSACFVFKI